MQGPGAEYVRTLVSGVLKSGMAMGHPYPTAYRITNPLRRPGELAVLLGNGYHLPVELARAYPKAPDDDGTLDG